MPNDGLPLVTPTAGLIAEMLAYARQRALSVPTSVRIPPLQGEVTLDAIAYNAVIAGCRPEELPLLLAATLATLDPALNLLGLQTTTGAAAVAMIVHGPAGAALGMNSGHNCLGPGNRANACIGRALSLILRSVGGAHPGVTDMSTMGQPGKYTFCMAEGSHPALPPLHVRRGHAASDSAVTVLGVSGTLEVLPSERVEDRECLVGPLSAAICAGAQASRCGRGGAPFEHWVLMPPEAWTRLAGAGCEWREFQSLLFHRCGSAAAPHADCLQLLCVGGVGEKMTYFQPWSGASRSVTMPFIP